MSLLDKEPVQRVDKILKEFSQSLKIIVLKNSAKTAEQAAEALSCNVGAIIKSLLFKNENGFTLCLVSGDKRCSLKNLKKIKNQKDISMASPEEVKTQTGYTIGGVSPVGHLKAMDIYIDKSLKRFKDLYAAAGHPNCVFKINLEDLIKLTNGKFEEIIE